MRQSRLLAAMAAGCALASAIEAAPPLEVSDLAWCPGSRSCLGWSASPGATSYTVYRGDPSGLPGLSGGAPDSALAGVFTAATTGEMLLGTPPSGGFYWYLVTASNADGQGTAGDASGGERDPDAVGTSCGDLAYVESFGSPDGGPWPSPFVPAGSVAQADVVSGMGRLQPTLSSYSLARMHAPLSSPGELDVEVTFALEFEDVNRQGVGFYVRQNGGYLQQTLPHGHGYAVFVEGFRGDGIGVWKEQDGNEISLQILFDPGLGFQNGVRYRVRYVVFQTGPGTTLLRAKVWEEGDPEPLAWQVDFTDDTAVLQGMRGGLAVDSWSTITSGGPVPLHTFVDDLRVLRLCAVP